MYLIPRESVTVEGRVHPILAILGNMGIDGSWTFETLAETWAAAIEPSGTYQEPAAGAPREDVEAILLLASARKFGVDLLQSVIDFGTAFIAAEGHYPDLALLGLLGAATVHVQQRNLISAEEILQLRCPPLLAQLEDRSLRAFHEMVCTSLLSMQGHQKAALARGQALLKSLKRKQTDVVDLTLLSDSYNMVAQICFRMGRHVAAMEHYKASLITADSICFELGKGRALRGLGVILSINRNLAEAVQALSHALEVFDHLNYGLGIIQTSTSLGQTYLSTSDLRHARFYLERARQRAEGMLLHKEQAELLSHLGRVHGASGDWSTALSCFEGDLRITSTLEDVRATAHAWRNVGGARRKLRDAPGAGAAFRESLQAFRTVEDDFNTALTLVRLAEASIDAGELQDAAEHL
ncbi:MAG: tetratricopeptide repeat protein, partial [Candidatus Xenobia bacterium]